MEYFVSHYNIASNEHTLIKQSIIFTGWSSSLDPLIRDIRPPVYH